MLAPTGCAAFNVSGCTLHSFLRIPVPLVRSLTPFRASTLQSLQENLNGCCLILVDEISMAGHALLGAMDSRLRQARPQMSRLHFGGIGVCMVGDLGQLAPVGDRPLFQSSADNASVLALQGSVAYRSVNREFFLTQCFRFHSSFFLHSFLSLSNVEKLGRPQGLQICYRVLPKYDPGL